MDRRDFVQRGLGAALPWLLPLPAAAAAQACGESAWITFYDPRLPRSRALARQLAGMGELRAARADPTELVLLTEAMAQARVNTALRGVTSEVMPFCLQHSRPQRVPIAVAMRRIDRDLFVWSALPRRRP